MRVYQSIVVSLFFSFPFMNHAQGAMGLFWGGYYVHIPYMQAGIVLTTIATDQKHTLHVDGIPTDLGVKGCTLYVLCSALNKVFLYDLPRETFIKSIPVGEDSRHLYVHGNRVFVTSVGNEAVFVINTDTAQLEKQIPLKAACSMMSFGEKKAYAYSIGQTTRALVVIDLETLERKKRIHLGSLPEDRNIIHVIADGPTGWVIINAGLCVKVNIYRIHEGHGELIKHLNLVGPGNEAICVRMLDEQGKAYFGSAKPIELYNELIIYKGLAYLFSGEGIHACTVYDLKSGQRLRTFPFPYCYGELAFTETHVLCDGKKLFHLPPPQKMFDYMLQTDLVLDYARLCPDAFKDVEKRPKPLVLSAEDQEFFDHLKEMPSLCQDHFYEILEPVETLFALTQIKDNPYLNSVEWKVGRRKSLLRELLFLLWSGDCAKAHMMVGFFLNIQDPTVVTLYEAVRPSWLVRGIKSLFSSSSSSSSTSSTDR